MVHIVESTVGRRYSGWFIRNAEHAQRVFDTVHASPLPGRAGAQAVAAAAAGATADASGGAQTQDKAKQKVAWGGVKA
jgi:translation initiation factor 3 subunit L